MVDIAKYNPVLAASEGAELVLKNPQTGKPIVDNGERASIRLLGRDAEIVADKVRELNQAEALSSNDVDVQSAAALDVLVAATVSWNITNDDKPLECNEKNARRLYEDHPWITEQAFPFILSRKNFSGNVPKS